MFFIDLQVKQQLNLKNSCQILRSILILLNKINNRLLYWMISIEDLNHGGACDITSLDRTDIDTLTTAHGLQQLMSESTHLH